MQTTRTTEIGPHMLASASSIESWREDLARADFMRFCQYAQFNELKCTSLLFPGLRGEDLVGALDEYANQLLRISEAIDMQRPPHVWLSRLARTLRADLFWINEEKSTGFNPTIHLADWTKDKWQRGRIAPGRDGRWKILAGRRHNARSRADVAHELAHAALYTQNGEINFAHWQEARWTKVEECVCNYLARRFLAPSTLLRKVPAHTNYAVTIIEQYAARFNIPLSVACLCWLDDPAFVSGSNRELILLWRQYHPLDHFFVSWVTKDKDFAEIRKPLTKFAKLVRNRSSEIDYESGWELWRGVECPTKIPQWLGILLEADDEMQAAIHLLRSRLQRLSVSRQSVIWTRLTGQDVAASFRPEWFGWRLQPDDCFVPCRRGGCKPDTLAYRLAGITGKSAQVTVESVHLADIVGLFESHGFAHGDATKGRRFILQLFREVS